MKKENTRIFPAGHRRIDLDYQCEDQVGDDETHIFPTPSYTGVSEGNSASSFDVSCSIRMSRCLVVIWALVTPICCCEAIARVSISCRIWCSLLLAFLVQVGRVPGLCHISRGQYSHLLQGLVGDGHFGECGDCMPNFGCRRRGRGSFRIGRRIVNQSMGDLTIGNFFGSDRTEVICDRSSEWFGNGSQRVSRAVVKLLRRWAVGD